MSDYISTLDVKAGTHLGIVSVGIGACGAGHLDGVTVERNKLEDVLYIHTHVLFKPKLVQCQ